MRLSALLFLLVAVTQACDHHHDEETSALLRTRRNLQDEEQPQEVERSPCGTKSPSDEHRLLLARQRTAKWHERYNDRRRLFIPHYTVDTYWHVIQQDEDTVGVVNDTVIQEAMTALNKAFSTTPFQFDLKGVNRTVDASMYYCIDADGGPIEKTVKSFHAVQKWDVLNVFVCNLDAKTLLGKAYYPADLLDDPAYDGVLLHNVMDSGVSVKQLYATLVHEVGHWNGLFHTFEQGCSAVGSHVEGTDDPYYYMYGDGVRDTPAHSEDTQFYEGYETCFASNEYNTCPDDEERVDPGNDPTLNIMNYVEPACLLEKGEFTVGQWVQMLAEFEEYRYGRIYSTLECSPVYSPCEESRDCCGDLICSPQATYSECDICIDNGGACAIDQVCCEGLTCVAGECQ